MAKKTILQTDWLQRRALNLTRIHFGFIALYAAVIVASDAWNLVTRELTWERWRMAGVLLIANTAIWYLARVNARSNSYYRLLIIGIVALGIILATFTVYTERGMASRGVALYALPIASAAALLNRSAIFGAAAISTAAYVLAATRYFYVFFNEGYKVELYTTLAFYSGTFFVFAAILWIVIGPNKD